MLVERREVSWKRDRQSIIPVNRFHIHHIVPVLAKNDPHIEANLTLKALEQ